MFDPPKEDIRYMTRPTLRQPYKAKGDQKVKNDQKVKTTDESTAGAHEVFCNNKICNKK